MKEFRLTNEQTGSLCGALGYLLEAGLGSGDALLVLSRDEKHPRIQGILQEMAAQADGGSPLHRVLRDAGCFPAYVCRLVAVGEQVGKTAQTLTELSGYYRRREEMARRMGEMLTYPAMLLAVLAAVVTILLVWVMPVFRQAYTALGTDLTGFAGWLLELGQGLRKALPWLGLVLLPLALALALPPVRRILAGLHTRLRGDRGVWRQIGSARYLQGLNLAVGCGMTDGEAAQLAARLAGEENPGLQKRCAALQTRLSQGQSLAPALEAEDFLRAVDRRLLEAGSRSGHTEQLLEVIARDSLHRSQAALERRVGQIEPAMVAVSCGVIAGVLLSVMVPLVGIMNTLG